MCAITISRIIFSAHERRPVMAFQKDALTAIARPGKWHRQAKIRPIWGARPRRRSVWLFGAGMKRAEQQTERRQIRNAERKALIGSARYRRHPQQVKIRFKELVKQFHPTPMAGSLHEDRLSRLSSRTTT